ncbi:DUF3108 domain-containing protein [Rhodoferax sp.]|uniref:DUF3108 domain-containing protein n=1 Tax=Rhodoferax sp. TaxID=50421 RepID=UPI00271C93B9|nr:DUF3108 domain-containing protein [Rhodoferax sp.]MDO9196750.1 DUF3108 domain-containing protein [Rhodoferax sp.]
MSSESARILPLKVLAVLSGAVLLAHLAILRGAPMTLGLSQPEPPRAFITRSIELVPARPTSAEQPVAPPAIAPRENTPLPAPKLARQKPAEALTSRDDSVPQPATVINEAEMPDPAATPPKEPSSEDAQLAAVPRPPPDRISAAMAYTVPGSVIIKYKVESNKFPFSAGAELVWRQDGASYEARLELSVFGQTRVQTSRGQVTPEGLAPTRFSDKYRSEVAAHFDREKGKVTFSANTPDVPLLAGAQDRLSILVQLAAMIAGDPGHYPEATTIAIQTIGPRDADTWLFTVGGEETLSLPGGEQATMKLVRNPRQEFDQKVELWLAPALGYLPVRIRITEPNGDFVDQKWLATEGQY